MNRLLGLLFVAGSMTVAGQESQPELCRKATGPDAVTVSWSGREYPLANEACREQFLSDPERYAQLYDALSELEKAGGRVDSPVSASLVPS
jgi:hypothetical protein